MISGGEEARDEGAAEDVAELLVEPSDPHRLGIEVGTYEVEGGTCPARKAQGRRGPQLEERCRRDDSEFRVFIDKPGRLVFAQQKKARRVDGFEGDQLELQGSAPVMERGVLPHGQRLLVEDLSQKLFEFVRGAGVAFLLPGPVPDAYDRLGSVKQGCLRGAGGARGGIAQGELALLALVLVHRDLALGHAVVREEGEHKAAQAKVL